MAQSGLLYTAMGVTLILFIALMLGISYLFYLSIRESLEIRFQNLDLVTELTRAKKRQEAINRELAAEVAQRRRAEKAVRRSERRFMLHVQRTPCAIIEWDPDLRVVAWNPAAERIFGYSLEDARERYALDLIAHPDDRKSLAAAWHELLAGRGATHQISQNITKDSRTIVCEWYNTRLVDEQGVIMGVTSLVQDITQRRRTEAALEEREALARAVINSLPASIAVIDRAGMVMSLNDAWQRSPDAYSSPLLKRVLVGTNCLVACRQAAAHDKTVQQVLDALKAVLDGTGGEFTLEYPRRGLTQTQWFMVAVSPLKNGRGGAVVSHINITQHKQAEEQPLLAAVFENTNEGILILNARRRIVAVNRAFTRITGYTPEDVMLRTPTSLASDRHGRPFYKHLWRSLKTAGQWQGEVWAHRKNGEVYPTWLGVNAVRRESGASTRYVVVFSDITRLKEAEQDLYQLAYKDALTGLPNRALFRERLQHALSRAQRYGTRVALMFLDLDHFKRVNDTFGHGIGDHLLKQVAVRLTHCVRKSDTVARLGGDEFTVLLEHLDHSQDAAGVAQKIVKTLSQPFLLDAHEVQGSVSIGISVYPDDGDTESALLRNADAAMYRVKEQGRARYQFYSAEMNVYSRERLWLEANLRKALERGELQLRFQPLVNVADGRLRKVEALLRWCHPGRGWIAPAEFIPFAEETGLIAPIGEWVLREACEKGGAWGASISSELVLAVNLSTYQLRQQNLVGWVVQVLEETDLAPARLELELTENQLMRSTEAAISTLRELRALGVKIAIDDFGTGNCSLGHLQRLPVDAVKIDRSFVADITTDPEDAAIARAIIAIAHNLKLEVVAEGVETAEQLKLLRDWQCDTAQGYYFSQPLPGEELSRLLTGTAYLWPGTRGERV
jgi:diguanylate cyclase (GGDEF)-like protein/PAS domain S-box-containing protein